MVEHLEQFAPRHWKVMGETDGRRVIRLGLQQSKKYGFTSHGPVRFYLELMFMFGSYFDTDPQHPWAIKVLGDPKLVNQMERADQLFNGMKGYLAEVSGPEHKHLKEAMQRLTQASMDEVVGGKANLQENLLRQLALIYPQKCDYLGEPVLRSLVNHGFRLAEEFSFATDEGRILVVALTFAVGHRFAEDPLYGWIGRRLKDNGRREPEKRIEQLRSKALLYLQHALQNERT